MDGKLLNNTVLTATVIYLRTVWQDHRIRTGKEAVVAYSKVLPFHLYGGTEENIENFKQGSSSWGGVRLTPLGTSATNWPVVPAPDDRWWMWSSRRNENWQGEPKYSEKTCPSATSSTTNPTWPDSGSNPGSRGGKPATNPLSYGTVKQDTQVSWVNLLEIWGN
jgi:hypothetical protein